MPKKYISFTIDVENPQTPLYLKRFTDNRIWSEGWGIEKLIEVFNEAGIVASFFTNVYEYPVWGLEEMRKVVRYIHESGQDVELHTHPMWVDEKRRENMYELSYREQLGIIKSGAEFIASVTGKYPTSHRAGAYGYNADTLKAVEDAGLLCDSSNFFGHPFCKEVVTKNEIVNVNGILEAPVTYLEHAGRYLKTDIDWLDEKTIVAFCKHVLADNSLNFVNIFMHSYSLCDNSEDYSTYTRSTQKVEKLRRIIDAVKKIDGFEILPMTQLTGKFFIPENPGRVTAPLPDREKLSNLESLRAEIKDLAASIGEKSQVTELPSATFIEEKKEIIFVKRNPQVRIYKEAWAIKKRFPDYKLILIGNKIDEEFFSEVFDEILYYNTLQELIQYITSNEPLVYHVHAEPNIEPAIVAEHSKVPVVYDVYDFSGVRYGLENLPIEERKYEKFALENCSAIVFKFPESILDYYREHGYKIDVPVMTYMDYCVDDYFSTGMPEENVLSLVYAGVLNPTHWPREKYGNNQYYDIVEQVVRQQIYYNIYINKWQVESENEYRDYLDLMKKNEYLKFNFSRPQSVLQNEIKDKSFGVSFHNFYVTNHNPLFGETSIGNKLSTYLEAGLPVIVSDNLKLNTKVVEDMGVGFGVPLDNMGNLREIIESYDYRKLKQNVLNVREGEMSALANVPRLLDFYKEINS